ncbi:MAG: hypothetical protein JWM47_2133 [Acidimicrobiales bacterium]|nr:hypothetical protein [Acidimicrobiales bacterium]
MTDATDPSTPASSDQPDTEAEKERLAEQSAADDRIRERAAEDLEPGGPGRTFADQGVREQVEERGDTHHPTGDGTGEV